jgi:hypothetical protein
MRWPHHFLWLFFLFVRRIALATAAGSLLRTFMRAATLFNAYSFPLGSCYVVCASLSNGHEEERTRRLLQLVFSSAPICSQQLTASKSRCCVLFPAPILS